MLYVQFLIFNPFLASTNHFCSLFTCYFLCFCCVYFNCNLPLPISYPVCFPFLGLSIMFLTHPLCVSTHSIICVVSFLYSTAFVEYASKSVIEISYNTIFQWENLGFDCIASFYFSYCDCKAEVELCIIQYVLNFCHVDKIKYINTWCSFFFCFSISTLVVPVFLICFLIPLLHPVLLFLLSNILLVLLYDPCKFQFSVLCLMHKFLIFPSLTILQLFVSILSIHFY
jgi:hypothetical protein